MSDISIGLACLIVTIIIYLANKKLYGVLHSIVFSPIILTPLIIIVLLLIFHIPYSEYISESHWLLWMLGPSTVAFAVPVYENRHIIRKHPFSLIIGVIFASILAIVSSVYLAHVFSLSEEIQRSLSVRSITTPLALSAAQKVGGQPGLVGLFVVLTGIVGMIVGDLFFLKFSGRTRILVRSGMAKGLGLGAASHALGTNKAFEIGEQVGVVSSLVMMFSGIFTVIIAPYLSIFLWK